MMDFDIEYQFECLKILYGPQTKYHLFIHSLERRVPCLSWNELK